MSISIGDAFLYLRSKDAGLDKGLTNAESKAKALAGTLGSAVKQMTGFDVASLTATGAVGLLAGAIVKGVRAYDDMIEGGRALTGTLDDLSDKFGVSLEGAKQLYGITKVMGLSVNALNMAFTTMAKHDIAPSAEGLRDVKARLDAVLDPAAKNKLAAELLGKSYLDLKEMLGLSNDEFDRYLRLGEDLIGVTGAQTDALDAYNRQLNEAKLRNEGLTQVLTRAGLATKNNISLFLEENKERQLSIGVLRSYGVVVNELTDAGRDYITEAQTALRLDQMGFDLRGKSAEQMKALAASVEANSKAYAGWVPNLYGVATAAGATGGEIQDMSVDMYLAQAAALALSGDKAGARYFYGLATAAGASADALARVIANYELMMSIGSGWSGMPGVGGVSVGTGGGGGGTGLGPRVEGPGGAFFRMNYDTGRYVPAQHGLDMIVPPGFPNDSFRIGATSGEDVKITPKGESGGVTVNITIGSIGSQGDLDSFLAQMKQAIRR